MDKEQILATLHTFNNQLTSMQRQVIAIITELSSPPAATVEQHTHTAGVTEGPTTAPSDGPTAEQPTPQVNEDQQRLVTALQSFIGSGSLFHKYLSPEVLAGAKGFLKSGTPAELRQYQEDISAPSIDKLAKWPSGFYRNRENKHVQFFVNTSSLLLYVDTSPEGLREPVVVTLPNAEGAVKRQLTELSVAEVNDIARQLEAKLAEFNDAAVRQG